MGLDLEHFTLELAEPLRTATGPIAERSGYLLRVAGEDRTGVGEATPLPGWTESLEACRVALEAAGSLLVSRGPEAALASLEGTPAARHGLALALADLRAKQLDVALYRRLGRSTHVDSVPANATIGDGGVEETVDAARDAVDRGFDCLKCKVGARSVEADRERLSAVRSTVGPDVTLRADANGAWDRETASAAVQWLDDLDAAYVEQPLPSRDLDGHATLRGGVGIALDESVATAGADAVLDRDVADVVVVKPMVLGGPDRAVDVARRARAQGAVPVVSNTIDAVVARTAAIHVAAALSPIVPCGLATADRLARDLGPDPAAVEGGEIGVPQSAGVGTTIDAD